MDKKELRVAVIGGRDYKDLAFMEEVLDAMDNYPHSKIGVIVSGGAKGADTLGEVWAQLNDIPTMIHEPKWDDLTHPDARIKVNKYGNQYDANAGHRRNKLIIDDCDIVVAFWDWKSPGTKNSLEYAYNVKKPGVVFRYGEDGKVFAKFEIHVDNSYRLLDAK